MSLKGWWIRARRGVLRRSQDDQDLDDEIQFHLAQEIELRVRRGDSPEDAEREARLAFGTIASVRERTRAVWVSTKLEQLLQDLRYGTRILFTAPALSATAILVVALVIGGNATVYSIANGVLRKPAPGVRADNIVSLNWVDNLGQLEPASSYANYLDLAAQSATLQPMLAFRTFARFTLGHDRGSYAVNGTLVSRTYFGSLGIVFAKGRAFNPYEDEGAVGLAAIISHRVWQDVFQGADDIIGRTTSLNGFPVSIVGVVEPGFEGTRLGESAGVWLPLVAYSRISGQQASLLERVDYTVVIGGQLAAGVTIEQATSELTAIWDRLSSTYSRLNHLKIKLVPYSAIAGTGTGIDALGDRVLALFATITLLTLVVACANVANLLLGRAITRQREIALRHSLGASRVRLLRMLFAEGLTISLIAVVAALGFAWWVSRAIVAILPAGDGAWASVAAMDFTPDWNVAAYALSLAALSVITFTFAPAIRVWRVELLQTLKAGEQTVIRSRSRLSRGLVTIQLAFSVLLLASAGLAFRSLLVMGRIHPGFVADSLLHISVNTSASAANVEVNRVLLEAMRGRIHAVPGVLEVSYASLPLFRDGGWFGATVRRDAASAESVEVQRNYVGPQYLQTLGIAPLLGGELTPQHDIRAIRGAVISQNLASALWPNEAAIGKRLYVRAASDFQDAGGSTTPVRPVQEAVVVGVTPDGFYSGLRRQQPRFLFLATQQSGGRPGDVAFYVRHRGTLEATTLGIGRTLRDLDTRIAISSTTPMATAVQSALWPVRTLTTLLILFAGLSLVIAAVGQYAVVAFDVRRRFREVGMRMALGASSRDVVRLVLREGLLLSGMGLAIGFLLSVGSGRVIGRVLYGVSPIDGLTYVGVFSLLFIASLSACYVPARRAASINPMVALRQD